jgi:DNA-3-methyladenine glycosylase II
MTPQALEHLRDHCKIMRRIIREIGPCTLLPETRRTLFESLVRAVAHQQLHGKAANSILRRFVELFGQTRFPSARQLASVSDEALRSCGFSRAKIASLRDIGEKSLSSVVPGRREISKMSDEEIITRLTEIRGVGRWTAEMILIFTLGRPDVLPVEDFGIRNGFRIAFALSDLPSPKDVLSYGQRWRPHSTTAAWYLWRSAEAFQQRALLPGRIARAKKKP